MKKEITNKTFKIPTENESKNTTAKVRDQRRQCKNKKQELQVLTLRKMRAGERTQWLRAPLLH